MADYTGYLRTVLSRRGGRTGIEDCYFQGAYKITRSVYLDSSGQPCLYVMNPGGGYVAGDVYRQELVLKPGAEAIVTTQSSTKIYKSGQLPAVQETEVSLGAGSLLEYMPDPAIAYQNARFRQQTIVRIEAGATLFYADVFTPGWAPDGTYFRYDWISSRLEAYQAGQLIVFDHLRLAPDEDFSGLGGMEGYTHLGAVLVLGERADAAFLEEVCHLLEDCGEKVRAGVSLLPACGFSVRLLGHSTQEVTEAIGLIHRHVRRAWFGRDPVFLRKY